MNNVNQFAGTVATIVFASAALAQAPIVSNVTMTQDMDRKVTITYQLDQPAVVTLDIETNVTGTAEWVSIGGENLSHVTGDANVLVKAAGPHAIYWQPDKAWPNHRIPNDGARAVVVAWAKNAPPEWMLVDLSSKSNVAYYASLEALPYGHPTNAVYQTSVLLMRKISAAGRSFRMGITHGEALQNFKVDGHSTAGDFSDYENRAPSHLVSFTNDFYMSVCQFTDSHYFTVKGSWATGHGASYKATPYDTCPRTEVSFNALRGTPTADHYDWPKHGHEVKPESEFGQLRVYTGVELDLPTEAQWEYACRAGEGRYRYNGDSTCAIENADAICWYDTAGIFQHPVGQKMPNAWMMYDMYGNGYELCLDWYEAGYANAGTIEPTGPQTGSKRVVRSAPSSSDARYMGSMLRTTSWDPSSSHKYLTYRLVAPAVAK